MKETTKAYLAGLFDGEGCISFLRQYENKSSFVLHAIIGSSDWGIINWLKDNFGGVVKEQKPNAFHAGFKRNKIYGRWILRTRNALAFLKEVYPYLKIKKKQAELAMKYYETVSTHRERDYFKLPQNRANLREKIVHEIRVLNGRIKE